MLGSNLVYYIPRFDGHGHHCWNRGVPRVVQRTGRRFEEVHPDLKDHKHNGRAMGNEIWLRWGVGGLPWLLTVCYAAAKIRFGVETGTQAER